MVEKAIPIAANIAAIANPYVSAAATAVAAGQAAYGLYKTFTGSEQQNQGHGHSHEYGTGPQLYQVNPERPQNQAQFVSDQEEMKVGEMPEQVDQEMREYSDGDLAQEDDQMIEFQDEDILYDVSRPQSTVSELPQPPAVGGPGPNINAPRLPPQFIPPEQVEQIAEQVVDQVIQDNPDEIRQEERAGYIDMFTSFISNHILDNDNRNKIIQILAGLEGLKKIYDLWNEKTTVGQITDSDIKNQFADLPDVEAQKMLPAQCRREKYWNPQLQMMTYMIVCEDVRNDQILRRVYFPK